MTVIPRGVVVAAHAAPGRWQAYVDASACRTVPAGDATDDRALVSLGRSLAEAHGGVNVRSVVLITGVGTEPAPRSLR